MYETRIERDSITQYGERLTTFVCTFPRFILAEENTHRMISKSSASSRAIPTSTQLKRLTEDPFYPVYWGKNQKGMSAEVELTREEIALASRVWDQALQDNMTHAEALRAIGVHKQIANRILEAFMWHTAILTATEWSNYFHLRDHEKAQPEFRQSVGVMSELYRASRPKLLREGEWHMPFVDLAGDDAEMRFGDYAYNGDPYAPEEAQVRISVGRCARVSYLNHEGKRSLADDFRMASELVGNGHMAPYEHVARPMTNEEREIFERRQYLAHPDCKRFTDAGSVGLARWIDGPVRHFLGNVDGWVQARKLIYHEHDALAIDRSSL